MTCESCSDPMSHPHILDADERALCETCSGYVCSLSCGRVCGPGDRLPFENGGKTRAHFGCIGKMQRALGWELASTLIARKGPAFKVSA